MPESPHPVDVLVGNRIRARRRLLGASQDQLAQAIGVSFQQVQKYENGTNRISCSRLVEIARYLNVTPADLLPEAGEEIVDTAVDPALKFAGEPGGQRLARAFLALSSSQRTALLGVAEAMQDNSPGGERRVA